GGGGWRGGRCGGAGCGHGQRVALVMENRPQHLLHLLALNAVGASAVPINPDYSHDEMLYQMQHSEADLAVVLAHRVPDLRAVAKARGEKPLPVASCEPLPRDLPRATRNPPNPAFPGRQTEAALLYTSGTTGRPKGCILTNDYFLNCGQWYRDIGRSGGRIAIEDDRERLINPLPLFHMNSGGVSFVCMILARGCLVLP